MVKRLIILSIILVPLDVGNMMIFLLSTVLLVFGMGMFQLGADTAMSPLGEGIGTDISKSKKTAVIIIISFIMGLLITIAEPDLVKSGAVCSESRPYMDGCNRSRSISCNCGYTYHPENKSFGIAYDFICGSAYNFISCA